MKPILLLKDQLLLFLCLIIGASLNAQIINVKAGPTFSAMAWENSLASTDDYFSKGFTGFYATVGYDYLQRKGFSLSSNIGYYSNGGKGKVNYSDEQGNIIGDTSQVTKLQFFTLNTLANYHFRAEKTLSPFIGLGIGMNYLVSYDENVRLLEQFDEADELNNALWGLIGTAGIHVNFNNIRVGAEFMYNYNLNKLVDSEVMPGFSNQVVVNYGVLLLSVGYCLK
jgi:hypothetical protein